jgi:hypothetical protein
MVGCNNGNIGGGYRKSNAIVVGILEIMKPLVGHDRK